MPHGKMYSPVQTGKKAFKRNLLEIVTDNQKELFDLRKNMAEVVEQAVDKVMESKLPIIEGRLALKEANIVKRLLIQKGIISEEEFLREFKGR